MPYISKVEMRGFKSFGNTKVSIPLSKGLTAIVGPNGNGKSNIVDALCFVLGWMSAKIMRAERFSDLLFNGADGNRPAPFAEVSLHFNNEDGGLKINSKEVVILRRVNRSGKCDYKINKRRTTREEIVDLLAASMTSPGGYNFVMQGEVNRFFSMDSVERRKIIDDLAGVAEYDDKKQKSLNELQKVEANLANAETVLREISTQMESLHGQMETALHFKQLKREHEQIQGVLLKIRRVKYQKNLSQLKLRTSKLQKEVEKLKSRLQGILNDKEKHDDRIGEINQLLDEKRSSDVLVMAERARTEITTLSDLLKDSDGRRSDLDRRMNSLSEQIKKLRVSAGTGQDAVSSPSSRFEKLHRRFVELNDSFFKCETYESAKGILEQIRAVLDELDDTIKEISRRLDEVPKLAPKGSSLNIDNLRDEIIGLQMAKSELDSQIFELKKKIQESNSKLEGADSLEKEIRSSIGSLTSEKDKLRLKVDLLSKKVRALEAKLRIMEGEHQQWQIKQKSVSDELNEINASLKKIGSEIGIPESADPVKLENRAQKIEMELASLAEKVNFRAIHDFRESERRYNNEKEKHDKLAAEKQSLLDFMREIDEKKKEIFMKTFNEIADQFTKIFRELSPSGDARLKLENELSPFEGGLEIVARPEGSGTLRICSLSGGQKAITALAFIFALQRFRPTTFYVLDEIDAHLDPKNRVRVAEMLRKFSRESQIVVVTLHDTMMSAADRLFGVTKQNGISNLYSVELSGIGG